MEIKNRTHRHSSEKLRSYLLVEMLVFLRKCNDRGRLFIVESIRQSFESLKIELT